MELPVCHQKQQDDQSTYTWSLYYPFLYLRSAGLSQSKRAMNSLRTAQVSIERKSYPEIKTAQLFVNFESSGKTDYLM